MATHKSEFLKIAHERGFIHQATHSSALDNLLAHESVPAYIGFDCTAPSLHVGSLIQIMMLRWLQKCGHKPLVLMGGATTKIGDPTGKDKSRVALDDAQIAANMQGIQTIFDRFLQFGPGKADAVMLNNADWLDKLNYMTFIRDIGRHFSINRMLTMDSVKLRIDRQQHMSFLEFNYMIFQGYDFVELNKTYGCRLQIGGSDQWGNIISGVHLHESLNNESGSEMENEPVEKDAAWYEKNGVFGLTTPLLTTSSGAKMGKTANGAVWLNAELLSPFDYWQFWRNTEDADVGKFLRLFTELPLDEIAKLETLQGAEINEAKKILANEATKLCHGAVAAEAAAETARKTFEEGGAGGDLKTYLIDRGAIDLGVPAYELFFMAGLKESKGEARKLIEGGGGRLNDEKITDARMLVTMAHVTPEGHIKLSAGKKHHLLVKPAG